MAKKKKTKEENASTESNLPVMTMEDCEAFDPSANKIAKSKTDEEEWEDSDDSDLDVD